MNSTLKKKKQNIKYEDYYLCYFDILGYKELFEKEEQKHKIVLLELCEIFDTIEQEIGLKIPQKDIQYRTFSDNVLICINHSKASELDAINLFCNLMRRIQHDLLQKYKILLRGGVTKGKFYIDKSMVSGKGLIDVVELEAKKAIYPRVIIDQKKIGLEAVQKLCNEDKLIKDKDGEYFINYLFSKECLESTLKSCKEIINREGKYHYGVKDVDKINRTKNIINKLIWLLVYYKRQCKKYGLDGKDIKYDLKINERLCTIEIHLRK